MKTKTAILLLTATIISLNTISQSGTWSMVSTNSPNCYKQSVAHVVVGNVAYMGVGSPYCFDWVEFNPITEVWTQKAPFPDTTGGEPATFSLNGKAYILSRNKNLWEFNPSLNSWTQKASCPGNIGANSGFYFSINNIGYFGGGEHYITGISTKEFWSYNPITDSWSRKSDFIEKPQKKSFFTTLYLFFIPLIINKQNI